MGKVFSLMGRSLRNFNIESRAHKIVSHEKPTAAPKYPSDQIAYEQIKENPEWLQNKQQKHGQLDQYLKDVYVKSYDPLVVQPFKSNPNRPLPTNRKDPEVYEYGFKEPLRIPLGKTTLRKALQFITDHNQQPRLHTPEKISEEHSIPVDTIKNILKYYKPFEVYLPLERKVKAKFAGPSVPRITLEQKQRTALPLGNVNKPKT